MLLISTVEVISIVTVVALVVIIALISIFNSRKKGIFTTRIIALGAVCVALSFALSFLKIDMPYGGSVTFASMVPLLIFTACCGSLSGLVVGMIYGLLQFLQAAWFITPVQFALDYILAFSSVAIIGVICYRKISISTLVLGTFSFYALRLVSHTLAGIIFYSMPDLRVAILPIFGDTAEMSALIYSLLYNLIYMIPESVIGVSVSLVLYKSNAIKGLISRLSAKVNN